MGHKVLLRAKEFARREGVHVKTVLRWTRMKPPKLRIAGRTRGGHPLFDPSDLRREVMA